MDTGRQRGKLREFSLQLAERIKAAPQQSAQPLRLAVRAGSDSFLIDMTAAGEIVPLPDVVPVPWTRPWFRGLANVRGRLIGVIDVAQLAGRPPLPAEQARQLLVFSPALKADAGILVTRAFGLRNAAELQALDAEDRTAPPWERQRYRDLDGTVLTELDVAQLVTSEAFTHIGT
ncbi:MAG: chemotaxis protein CheW [Sutterellaceae bacterium]|nr:chemotaxis protein CheW [Burkholderiaceae bacterium]MCX7900865.1 chemotaxis protein CheW [Burkholderiaceae bacterium]MDW8430045.1 chemotaxis protein CheW [Sutterellaceae bacterium]